MDNTAPRRPLSLKARIVVITTALLIASSWIFAWQVLMDAGRQLVDQAFDNAASAQRLLIESIHAYTQGLARARETQGLDLRTYNGYQEDILYADQPGLITQQDVVDVAGTYKVDNGAFLISNTQGGLIYSTMPELVEASINLPTLQSGEALAVLRELEGQTFIYVSSYAQLLPADLCRVDFALDISPVVAVMEQTVSRATLILILISLLLMAILYVVISRTFRPLSELGWQARAMAKGEYGRRAIIKKMDEVGALADDFNTMADAVEKHTAELSETAKRRELFAANLSHEIKTPITSIVGYADLATSMTLDPDTALESQKTQQIIDMLGFIKREGRRLDTLSETLLQWSELHAGNGIERHLFDSNRFLQHVEYILMPFLAKQRQTLRVENTVGRIYGDEALLISLVVNLCKNAVKASVPDSEVDLKLDALPGGALSITVSDTGEGMAAAEISRVIEPFYMVDKARDRRHGGAGMGLALCHSIVTTHGGDMEIESVKGQGTTIRAVLPGAIQPEDHAGAEGQDEG